MKTHHLTFSAARPRFASLLFLLLMSADAYVIRAQQLDPIAPEPVPDANGKIPYVPSPFPGIPQERYMACHAVLRTLTPEVLRALPDDSELLADLLLFEVTTTGRSPKKDMIEREMWRRGDVAIRIVKELFEHPFNEDIPIEIALWLRFRPWMKPEEFLPLARRWYDFNDVKRPGYTNSYASQQTMAEFFSWWGEAKDEALINDYFNKHGGEPAKKDFLMRKFKERQELRTQGKPHGMPEWFFDPKHKMDRHTAIPLSDCTKTYEEKKAEQAK